MNRRVVFGGAIGVLLVVLSAWAFGWLETEDPVVAELEQLRDEGIARHDEMTEEEKKTSRQEFGERIRDLPEEQRRKFFESSMPIFMKMAEARIDRFLEMTSEQQNAELDKKIDEMQARQTDNPGGSKRDPKWGQKSAKEIDDWRKKMLDWTTPEQRAKFEFALAEVQRPARTARAWSPKAARLLSSAGSPAGDPCPATPIHGSA